MITTTILQRVFILSENGQEIKLSDPSEKFTPEAVRNFYAHTYPALTNAQIEGPVIEDDAITFRFVTVLGTKG